MYTNFVVKVIKDNVSGKHWYSCVINSWQQVSTTYTDWDHKNPMVIVLDFFMISHSMCIANRLKTQPYVRPYKASSLL